MRKSPTAKRALKPLLVMAAIAVLLLAGVLFIVGVVNRGRIEPATFSEIEMLEGAPAWRGLVPGLTSKSFVLRRLGAPDRSQKHDATELLFYRNEFKWQRAIEVCDRITLINGRVEAIVLNLSEYSAMIERLTVGDVLARFGTPPAIRENTLLYPELGMTFVVYENTIPTRILRQIDEATFVEYARRLEKEDITQDTVIEYVMLYLPTSMAKHEETLGQYHPLDNPWESKIRSYLDLLPITPGRTTRSQTIELLGEPDLRGFSLRFFQYYMIYRMPGLQDRFVVRIFFDWKGRAEVISAPVSAQAAFTLREAVAQYGIPCCIDSSNWGDNIPPRTNVHRVMWSDRGVICRTHKLPDNTDCSLPSQFPPTGREPCAGWDDIITHFIQFVPRPDAPSQVIHRPQFDWSP